MICKRWTFLFLGLVLAVGTVVPAAAQSANPVTTAIVASTSTAIPGGTGNFTNFYPSGPVGGYPGGPIYPAVPAISAGNVVFWGAGSNGQQGIYAIEAGVLTKVADLETPIPAGTGDFTNFFPSSPVGGVPSGPFVAFAGFGANSWQGVYVAFPSGPVGGFPNGPVKIADLATAIPGNPIGGIPGTPPNPYFTGFLNPALSGLNAAFIGFGADGWQGVYVAIPSGPVGQFPSGPIGNYPPVPIKVADLATPIPGGAGNFTGFAMLPSNPRVNGQTVAFIGLGTEVQQGIYVAWPPSPVLPPSPIKVADTATLIPGDSLGRTFAGFSDIAWPPNPVRTPTLAFVGSAVSSSVPGYPAQPFQGVYAVKFAPLVPSSPIVPSSPFKIADLTTPVPGGGAFVEFGSVSVSGSGAVVFDAWYSDGGVLLHGLFTNIAGTLMKVLDNTESVAGKPLADFGFGSGGFGGARAVFTALFQDGSQAISVARVNELKCSQDEGDEPCEL